MSAFGCNDDEIDRLLHGSRVLYNHFDVLVHIIIFFPLKIHLQHFKYKMSFLSFISNIKVREQLWTYYRTLNAFNKRQMVQIR